MVQIVLRLFACACAVLPIWLWLGPVSLALCAPLFGIALAKPILDLISDYRHFTRALAFREVEGRHYAYKGVSLKVIQDESYYRWVSLADIRKIVDNMPTDLVLEKIYSTGYLKIGYPPSGYLNDEALIKYLGKTTASDTLKFRHWAERSITFPARSLRERNRSRPITQDTDQLAE